jgi:hypothetical protein
MLHKAEIAVARHLADGVDRRLYRRPVSAEAREERQVVVTSVALVHDAGVHRLEFVVGPQIDAEHEPQVHPGDGLDIVLGQPGQRIGAKETAPAHGPTIPRLVSPEVTEVAAPGQGDQSFMHSSRHCTFVTRLPTAVRLLAGR